MTNSVNTNVSAMIALQNLNTTNAELATTQGRINTGLRIANAKDNGAIWAIAQNQRANSTALNAVRESLQRAQSTVDVAISAGETVSDLLLQMKEKALAAADSSLDANSRVALNEDFKALRDQLAKAVDNAVREVSVGIIYTSIVLFAGFSMFAFSHFGGIKALGLLTTMTLLTAMLTNLLVLPSLVLSLNKRIMSKAFSEPLLEILDEEDELELGALTVERAKNETTDE